MYTKSLTIAFEPRKQCGELRDISSAAATHSMKAAPHELMHLASAVSTALKTAARNNAQQCATMREKCIKMAVNLAHFRMRSSVSLD
jgi:hypothetical protein